MDRTKRSFLIGFIALFFGAMQIACACPIAEEQPLAPMSAIAMNMADSHEGVPCHDSEQEESHACPHCDQAPALKAEASALATPIITTHAPDYAPYLQMRAPPVMHDVEVPIIFAALSLPRIKSSPVTNKVRLLN